MRTNVSAQHFWAASIATLLGEAIYPVSTEIDRAGWAVFSFESKSCGT